MSTYYEFIGKLTFKTEVAAAEALRRLREESDGDDVSVFWRAPSSSKASRVPTDLKLSGRTLTFASKGFADGESFYTSRALVAEISRNAIGRVRVQGGDGGPGTEIDHYGRAPKAASKTATKRASRSTRRPRK